MLMFSSFLITSEINSIPPPTVSMPCRGGEEGEGGRRGGGGGGRGEEGEGRKKGRNRQWSGMPFP